MPPTDGLWRSGAWDDFTGTCGEVHSPWGRFGHRIVPGADATQAGCAAMAAQQRVLFSGTPLLALEFPEVKAYVASCGRQGSCVGTLSPV